MGTPHERCMTSRLSVLPTAITTGLVAVPVLAGLIGTLLPAFGILPALGGHTPSLEPWRVLLAQPGLAASIWLTLTTGFGASLLSLLAVALFCAGFHGTRGFRLMQAATAPILATPHIAIAIGFLALAAPSGVIARLLAPAMGWHTPPDLATVNDDQGLALILGLVLKEAPYLLLMTLASLNQIPAGRLMAVATSLGHPAPVAWLKVIFPLVYRQIRLPVLAVLAYALSVVDIAILLGPDRRPPLAVLVVRWFFDPDLAHVFPAAAAACLVLLLTTASVASWLTAERAIESLHRIWAASGHRLGSAVIRLGGLTLPVLLAIALLSLLAAALWSIAGPWRFPDALPSRLDASTWTAQIKPLAAPFRTTLLAALAATGIALALSVAALEAVATHGRAARPAWLKLTMLPLLVPQAAFLFGVQVVLLALGLDGGWPALIWAHLVFVLPYVLLSLTAPYAAIDPRLADIATCLGASRMRTLLSVKLPILLRPLLAAAAIGMAVSAGQYLTTLFAGGGRLATLATEAITLASGGDRRVMGVFAVVQTALPLLFYAAAILLPRLVWRNRAALRA
jgi:putative thiamine transport system permease protein